MRFGAPIFDKCESAEEWAAAHKKHGYNAAYCPIGSKDNLYRKDEYIKACEKYDIIIAEAGAWSNPMACEPGERKNALEHCKNQLYIADEMGANCCVNIAGNIGDRWDGHSAENLTPKAFDAIVETTREIIDAVKPKRTYYTLEMMPWMYPYDEETYADLIKAIDREHFAAHLDIVNTINSPQRYYSIQKIIKACFTKLGGYIKSIHVKDIFMSQEMTVHLSEIIAGKGNFDYKCLIEEVKKLNADIPLMLEHLSTEGEYLEAGSHIKKYF
jgi:sugar phosphate isomerase/epimerase